GEDAMKTTWTYLNIVADTIPLALEKNIDTKKKMSVYSVEGGIILKDAPLGQDVFIYNIQGQLIIKERSISTEQSYNLNRGFYIVRTVNEFKKVVVR
ncbi:MAG: T9SS type A sorting domain-containing protein, partial [Bacteroidales bacterium]